MTRPAGAPLRAVHVEPVEVQIAVAEARHAGASLVLHHLREMTLEAEGVSGRIERRVEVRRVGQPQQQWLR